MDSIKKELIEKYFSGNCSPEEQELVSRYLQGEDAQRLMEEYINEVEQQTNEEELPAALIETELKELHRKVSPARTVKVLPFMKVAAAVAAILLCTAAVFWFNRPKTEVQKWIAVANDGRGLKRMTLADGTQVWLNVHSALEYDEQAFNDKVREVKVKGEVFFDVAHNPGKPFVVHAGDLTTTVKGTSFNVEAYQREHDVRVTLVRGKVAIDAGGKQYMMSPGERVIYDSHNQNLNVKKVEPEISMQWIQGTLVFDDLPLADVLQRIEDNYNIHIVYHDKALVDGKRIRGQYQRRTAEEVLTKVLFIHGLQVRQEGGAYVIER